MKQQKLSVTLLSNHMTKSLESVLGCYLVKTNMRRHDTQMTAKTNKKDHQKIILVGDGAVGPVNAFLR